MANSKEISAREPITVLRLLAEQAVKFPPTKKTEAIEVRLFLKSGQTLGGWLKSLALIERGREVVCLGTGDIERPGLIVVSAEEIIGLQVEPSDLAKEALSEAGMVAEEVPTRLELKRRIKDISEKLGLTIECDWDTIGDSIEERQHFNDILPPLLATFKKIASDHLAKAALKEISTISLGGGPGARADWTHSNKTLRLKHDFRMTVPGIAAGDFSKQVEAVL